MRGISLLILLVLTGAVGLGFAVPAVKSLEPESNSHSISSSPLSLTSDGMNLCVVNPDSDSLSLIDTSTATLLAEIPVGDNPRSVAVLRSTAYVTNHGSDSISIVDIETLSVTGTIPVGDRPLGAAISPDGRFLAVAEMGQDSIRFIETSTLSTLVIYPVSDRPYGLSFTPDGSSLLVSHLLSGEITRLSVRPYTTYLPDISINFQASISKNTHQESTAQELLPDRSSFSITETIPTWTLIAPAPSVQVNSTGTRAYLPQTMGNGQGMNTQFDTTVFPVVSVVNLDTGSHEKTENISLADVDQPVGLPWDSALTKNDTELWVVNAGSNNVSVINISNPNFPTRVANIGVSHNPRGIVFSLDGNTAYVNNTLAGTVSVIDTQAYSVTDEITSTAIPLPPLLLEGKRLFHSSARPELAQASWISCNTCHIEGEHDGRTWFVQFLGEIPPGKQQIIKRNTTSLLGMVETYPLRWSAEWDESADSEFSIRFEQFGTGLIPGDLHPTLGDPNQGRSAELDALAAFIDSLQVPIRQAVLSPSEIRGKQVFDSAQTRCLSCHPPPLYTDLKQHNVGTGDKPGEWFGPEFDTPTLRYLFDSPPYLHDGSSPDLLHLLTELNASDQHGITSHLSDQEIEDLITYLLAIPHN